MEKTYQVAAEIVLFQCNLVENQYQQKSETLYTFTPSKFYGCF